MWNNYNKGGCGCGCGHSQGNSGAMCCEGFEFNKTVEYQCCCTPIKQTDCCCPKQQHKECGCGHNSWGNNNNCCGGY